MNTIKVVADVLRVLLGCGLFTVGLVVLVIGIIETSFLTVMGSAATVIIGAAVAGPKRLRKELRKTVAWWLPLP